MEVKAMNPGNVQHINPEGMANNPAFTQMVVVTGQVKTVYVGGQDAVDATGAIVGKGDIRVQTEQVFRNLETALAAAGAGLEHIIKWTIFVVQGQPIAPAFGVFQQFWGQRPNPPAISVLYVAGLVNPDFLCEMEAIAVVPQDG